MSWRLTIIDPDDPIPQGDSIRVYVNVTTSFLCGNCLKDFDNHFDFFTVDGYVTAKCPDCQREIKYSVGLDCWECTHLEYIRDTKEFVCHKFNRVVGKGGKKSKGGYRPVPQEDNCFENK